MPVKIGPWVSVIIEDAWLGAIMNKEVRLANQQVARSTPGCLLPGNDSRQVVHKHAFTHVPLSPSSIIW